MSTVKRTRICMILAALTVFSGCYDIEDIDQRMIISLIGIDALPGDMLRLGIRMPLIKTRELSGFLLDMTKKDYILRTADARRLSPAYLDMQSREEHALFMGQCRSVILGEAFARRGILPAMDFLNRQARFPPSAQIMIAAPSAEAVLNIQWLEVEFHDQNIRSFVSNIQNPIISFKKWMLFRNIEDPLADPILPVIRPSDDNHTIKFIGTGVFNRDRMVGMLDVQESVLLGILLNNKKTPQVSIPFHHNIPSSFTLMRGKTEITACFKKNRILFAIRIRLRGFLNELGGLRHHLSPEKIEMMENKSASYLRRRFILLLRRLQSMGSDPLELGYYYRIRRGDKFSIPDWRRRYPEADFKVNVDFVIDRLGALR
ncbi:MAG: Ger(x)C family spore germination protein [Bacillota bacterium]